MDERLKPYQDKMDKTIQNLSGELDTIRAGRANPHVLDRIMVDYYGSPTPIKNVANVTVPEARLIQIQPWEGSMVKEIIKAIQMSDLGINPNTDGKTVRLVFPELTEERRKQLSKEVKKKGEESKVAIRNIRRDGNEAFKKLEKSEDVSEDVVKELQEDLQKTTDSYSKKIDGMIDTKIKELMTV
ncbi:MAG: ribosome recycling factor [Eubacteriales bacterium]|jgi:ribosome recycling factor